MLSTAAQALAMAERLGEGVGLALDVYHIWWDPALADSIARARGRIAAFHVCDWLVPTRDLVLDRGMMGDGVIDVPGLRAMVDAAGYAGLIEVEIMSTLELVAARPGRGAAGDEAAVCRGVVKCRVQTTRRTRHRGTLRAWRGRAEPLGLGRGERDDPCPRLRRCAGGRFVSLPALLIANENSRRGREIEPFIAALEAGGLQLRREPCRRSEESRRR